MVRSRVPAASAFLAPAASPVASIGVSDTCASPGTEPTRFTLTVEFPDRPDSSGVIVSAPSDAPGESRTSCRGLRVAGRRARSSRASSSAGTHGRRVSAERALVGLMPHVDDQEPTDLLAQCTEDDLGVLRNRAGRPVDVADHVLGHGRRRPEELPRLAIQRVDDAVLPGMPVRTRRPPPPGYAG